MPELCFLKRLVLWVTLLTAGIVPAFAADNSLESMCREAGEIQPALLTPLDRQAYQTAMKEQGFYQFFQLAEGVSTRNAYKGNNNQRVLQLICWEAFAAPAESEAAIEDAYYHWQSGQHFIFNICRYVTSGAGGSFCAERWANQQEKDREDEIKYLIRQLTPDQQNAVKNAYKTARVFYTEKAYNEEFHGGSGHVGSRIESINAQKDLYISRISSTLNGILPLTFPDFQKADKVLNENWYKVKDRLMRKPITGFNMNVSYSGVRDVQRHWLDFRDTTVTMLASLNAHVTAQQWKALLTQERTEELKYIIDYAW